MMELLRAGVTGALLGLLFILLEVRRSRVRARLDREFRGLVFGVPQERYRSILMGSTRGPVEPPTRTHAEKPAQDLFGNAPLPWVSMAEGLGWGMTDRPCVTVTGGGSRTGGPEPIRGRKPLIERERERERESSLDTEGCGARA